MNCKSSSEISRIEARLAHPVNRINELSINILFNICILKFTNIHQNVCGIIDKEREAAVAPLGI
jgi:hypothetical protein